MKCLGPDSLSQISRIQALFPDQVLSNFLIIRGADCELEEFEGRAYIPLTKNFLQIKFINQSTGRRVSVFICLENCNKCQKLFRKWHNLFDHLRIHTGERPFECPVDGCKFAFNQLSNQKKHLDVHRGAVNLRCKACLQTFPKASLVDHFERDHKMVKGDKRL
ncbi:hypothetical protein FGO68_gene1753 [Halteria grandinella]|uniref:C2H2-type domain-containing protein n=1 Tax=Halteria grandinella TaxID=5974 RepID=A0A8J8NE36_HALGN|nr:hypothetical protein FGO68_gene1753 [Halteria grandinella]